MDMYYSVLLNELLLLRVFKSSVFHPEFTFLHIKTKGFYRLICFVFIIINSQISINKNTFSVNFYLEIKHFIVQNILSFHLFLLPNTFVSLILNPDLLISKVVNRS